MKIINKNTNSLIPYNKNPRFNDDAVDAVAWSIRQFGFRVPILIDKESVIIAGHTRLKAALKLGLAEVPCIVADHLTPIQVKEYRIADNKLGELSSWNYELLEEEILSLQDSGLDLEFLDFSIVDLSEPIEYQEEAEGKTSDNATPEMPEDPVSEPGEIYRLGNHLLLCGDGLEVESYRRLLGEDTASLSVIDIPVEVDAGRIPDVINCNNEAMSECASAYVFYRMSDWASAGIAMKMCGWKFIADLFWVKKNFDTDKNNYHPRAEAILFASKSPDHPQWHGARTTTNILRHDRPKKKNSMPLQKPVELIVQLLKNSTSAGDIVVDGFGGSGSTLIACEKTGRKCRMIEIEPKRCDVIRKRWAEFVYGEDNDWQSVTLSLSDQKNNKQQC